MFVTEDTSHAPIGWLKLSAPLSMCSMLSTDDMFHPPIGWLNCVLSPNRLDMSVTRLTSQLGMSLHAAAPHRYAVVVGSSHAGSDEQHWSPVPPGTGPRQLFTAA